VYEDPLVVAAREYAIESGKLLDALETQPTIRAKVDVRDAVDSLQWLSTMIAPKICRALTGLIDPLSPVDLIRFGGHLSCGGYDVQTDGRHTEAAPAPPVH
jgi:hypothetical protein